MSLNARIAALTASATVLAGAAAAAATSAAPAIPTIATTTALAPAASPAAGMPRIDVKPGVVRLAVKAVKAVKAQPGPFTTAQCEKTNGIACYQPGQIRAAYNLQALYANGITGKGATIDIVDSFGSPTIRQDLKAFDKRFGLPAPPEFQIVTPAGRIPTYNPSNSDREGWASETTLDVEYAHALAPDANIVLAETPVSETEGVHGFPQIVAAEKWLIDNHKGDVISQSFSATEQTFTDQKQLTPLRAAYEEAFTNHVTVLAASGDSGATGFGLDQATYYTHPVTSWPDSDPLVTAVGGTRLTPSGSKGTSKGASTGRTFTSVTWNDTYDKATNEYWYGDQGPAPLASGGGMSVMFSRPAWQNGVSDIVGSHRGVPDISMNAACSAPVNIYGTFGGQLQPGWSLVCGTSEATPEFAAIVALADQVAGKPLGLINPALYQLSARHAPGIVDVTSGNNTVSFFQGTNGTQGTNGKQDTATMRYTVTGFAARRGYDLATGVGTIDGPLLVHELAGR